MNLFFKKIDPSDTETTAFCWFGFPTVIYVILIGLSLFSTPSCSKKQKERSAEDKKAMSTYIKEQSEKRLGELVIKTSTAINDLHIQINREAEEIYPYSVIETKEKPTQIKIFTKYKVFLTTVLGAFFAFPFVMSWLLNYANWKENRAENKKIKDDLKKESLKLKLKKIEAEMKSLADPNYDPLK